MICVYIVIPNRTQDTTKQKDLQGHLITGFIQHALTLYTQQTGFLVNKVDGLISKIKL